MLKDLVRGTVADTITDGYTLLSAACACEGCWYQAALTALVSRWLISWPVLSHF